MGGFLPTWFEFLAMKAQSENGERAMQRREPFWDLMIPSVCSPHYREEREEGWFALRD